MPERNKKFHDFAIKSILFKGRSDWYYCYLKAEKIAHVLLVLKQKSALTPGRTLQNLVHNALTLPQHIAHFAAGEMDLAMIVGDIFGLLSFTRLAATEGALSAEHALIVEQEYEQLAEKIAAGNRLSPFISANDFSMPTLPAEDLSIEAPTYFSPAQTQMPVSQRDIKDIKGHTKGQEKSKKGHAASSGDRVATILQIVTKNKQGISIKGISSIVKDCSEKTIQRELVALIEQGVVRKEGDRRWSLYYPA